MSVLDRLHHEHEHRAKIGDSAIVDGVLRGEIVREYAGGQFLISIDAPERFVVSATWDGETRAASTNEPLMVAIDSNY